MDKKKDTIETIVSIIVSSVTAAVTIWVMR